MTCKKLFGGGSFGVVGIPVEVLIVVVAGFCPQEVFFLYQSEVKRVNAYQFQWSLPEKINPIIRASLRQLHSST